jgi:two-component system, LuxR family, sensor kinase FixL
MSWVTAVWSMLMGGCVAMALPHLFMAIRQRRAVHWILLAAITGIAGMAATELAMMHAHSAEQFSKALRWAQVPIFILVVSIVAFVRLYFGAGRLWLGIAACAIRFVCLIINFAFPQNLNFREITALRPVHFLGDTVSLPIGVASPWTRLGELSSLLLLAFVVDASLSLWRRGKPNDRRRALIVGGSITLFILLAAGSTTLIHLKVLQLPYVVSLPFALIVVGMAFELGYDMFAAAEVGQKLNRSEASLYESEARFRTMANAAPVMIWMSGVDRLCTFFNNPWLEFTGRSMEQELGNGWADGVHADDLQKCFKTYTEAFDARQPFVMQYRLRRNDGEYRWVSDQGVSRYDAQGEFAGYIGSCVDVTELVNKDVALRESEERMRLAAEAVNLGIWEWDLDKDEIWAMNSREALLGWPASGKIGFEDFISRVHPDDRDRIRQLVDDTIHKGQDFDGEYRLVLPDGIVRWMATRGSVRYDANSKPNRVLGISIDITARKQAELEAKERRDELSHLSRVALVGELSASIAHELNQPLAGILTNAGAGECLIDGEDVDLKEIRELLADISVDAHRASEVVRGIRGMIKKDQGTRRRINLNDVVTNVVQIIGSDALLHACELKTSLEAALPIVEVDPVQIQQVLINLIVNAFDAMRDTPVSKRRVEIMTQRNGDGAVCISVRDYGVGISDEIRGRIFEQFFTTKPEGLGMGLAIVRSIIEEHAGTIEAENAESEGARFHFNLPTSARG